jgi:hypothetical protein
MISPSPLFETPFEEEISGKAIGHILTHGLRRVHANLL